MQTCNPVWFKNFKGWLQNIPIQTILVFVVLTVIFFAPVDSLFSQNAEFRVKYLSSEFIYIDAGSIRGLSIGDQLTIKRGEKQVAVLEIVFTASHSSSCKVIYKNYDIQVNDLAVIKQKNTKEDDSKSAVAVAPKTRERTSEVKPYKAKKSKSRITGNVSFQNYWYKDLSGSGTIFYQPAIRLKVRGKNLWNRDWNFRLKFRSRYNQYQNGYSSFFEN